MTSFAQFLSDQLKSHWGIVVRHIKVNIRFLARRGNPKLLSLHNELAVLVPILIREANRRDRLIATYSDMVLSTNVDCVLEVADYIFASWLRRIGQERH